MNGRHGLFAGLDDDVRRSVAVALGLPVQRVVDRFRRRHIGRVAFDGALIDPLDDRVDLVVGKRHVVLEVLNPDAAVDVPRRHLTRRHSRPNGFRPRPRVLESHQRHRRNRSRLMARLTPGLEDRRDVLCERDGLGGFSGRSGDGQEPAHEKSTYPHRQFRSDHSELLFAYTSGQMVSRSAGDVPSARSRREAAMSPKLAHRRRRRRSTWLRRAPKNPQSI